MEEKQKNTIKFDFSHALTSDRYLLLSGTVAATMGN